MGESRSLIGTSGWMYDDWRGRFYPEKLAKKRWFEHYSSVFQSVEINATYYRLMPESTFKGWAQKAPADFTYSVKMWKEVTHRRKLVEAAEPVEEFCRRAGYLGSSLGPILIQLPPSLRLDTPRLLDFLKSLPREPAMDFVFEFRRPEWFCKEVFEILRHHEAGLVLYDHPDIQTPRVVTSETVYIRFHGKGTLYGGKYDRATLAPWVTFLKHQMTENRRVYAYFNNDRYANAVADARMLREMVEKE